MTPVEVPSQRTGFVRSDFAKKEPRTSPVWKLPLGFCTPVSLPPKNLPTTYPFWVKTRDLCNEISVMIPFRCGGSCVFSRASSSVLLKRCEKCRWVSLHLFHCPQNNLPTTYPFRVKTRDICNGISVMIPFRCGGSCVFWRATSSVLLK